MALDLGIKEITIIAHNSFNNSFDQLFISASKIPLEISKQTPTLAVVCLTEEHQKPAQADAAISL